MTNDPVQFLREMLEDDRDLARAAQGAGQGKWRRAPDRYDISVLDETGHKVVQDADGFPTEEEAAHIAWHDPARVLAEVEAKQRTLVRHSPHAMGSAAHDATCDREHWGVLVCNHDGRTWPCPDLVDLASGYQHHRKYREEWRP